MENLSRTDVVVTFDLVAQSAWESVSVGAARD
jgi:hypothetical protein